MEQALRRVQESLKQPERLLPVARRPLLRDLSAGGRVILLFELRLPYFGARLASHFRDDLGD